MRSSQQGSLSPQVWLAHEFCSLEPGHLWMAPRCYLSCFCLECPSSPFLIHIQEYLVPSIIPDRQQALKRCWLMKALPLLTLALSWHFSHNCPLTYLSPSLVGDPLKARDPVGFVSLVYKPLIAPEYKPPPHTHTHPGNLCTEYLFSAVICAKLQRCQHHQQQKQQD